jgi:hypothetical protein
MRIRRLIAAVAVVAGSAAGVAAPAHADPQTDQAFLDALREQGVPVASDAEAIARGHSTCDQLHQGDAPIDVLRRVESSTNWSQDVSISFISVSAQAYCPDMTAKLQEAAAAPPPAAAAPAPGGQTVDEGFLDALQARTVPITSDAAAIELAHSTCALLQRGGSAEAALAHVANDDALRHVPSNRDRELKNVQAFTSIAVGAYCPEMHEQ